MFLYNVVYSCLPFVIIEPFLGVLITLWGSLIGLILSKACLSGPENSNTGTNFISACVRAYVCVCMWFKRLFDLLGALTTACGVQNQNLALSSMKFTFFFYVDMSEIHTTNRNKPKWKAHLTFVQSNFLYFSVTWPGDALYIMSMRVQRKHKLFATYNSKKAFSIILPHETVS